MSTRRQTILIVLLIVASTLLVYGHTIRNQFLNWDDYDNITENYLFNPVTPANIKRLWTEPFLGLYVPATYTLMGLESHFATRHDPDFGASITPALFRAVSVGMHLLCALMVFAILRRFTNHPWAAGAGALLFALHPLQAESVCWITEQRGLLAAAFGIGALVLLQGPREKISKLSKKFKKNFFVIDKSSGINFILSIENNCKDKNKVVNNLNMGQT